MSRNQLWVDAFYSSSLGLQSECGVAFLAVADLANDGSDRLLALLVGYEISQLKILNGADLQCEIELPETAVALCTFTIDASLPGIAVGAGSSLYIYKNFKPYYKYTLPQDGPKYAEEAQITQLAALPRSSPDVSASSLLLVGTEHNSLLIIDSQTFNAISRVELAGTPTFIRCSGYYDVEATIVIGTSDAGVFTIRSDQQPIEAKPFIASGTEIVDMAFNGNVIAVANSNRSIKLYTSQGQEIRKIVVGDFILAMTWIEMRNQDVSLLAVSLAGGRVLFYRQDILVDQLSLNSNIVSMIYGRFGREDGVLILVSKDGDLIIKIMNRGYKLSTNQNQIPSTDSGKEKNKPLWPAKTKLFVEQTKREKDNPEKMYHQFREGICRLHLRALQALSTRSSSARETMQLSNEPTHNRCVHLVAKLLGSGTRFMLQLLVQNTSNEMIDSLSILIQITDGKLELERTSAKLSLLSPGSQHWIKINARDATSQGGQVYVIVNKEIEQPIGKEDGNSRGVLVFATKINISPTI